MDCSLGEAEMLKSAGEMTSATAFDVLLLNPDPPA
jgi:hypothetical protein